jgi:hypothetical protein
MKTFAFALLLAIVFVIAEASSSSNIQCLLKCKLIASKTRLSAAQRECLDQCKQNDVVESDALDAICSSGRGASYCFTKSIDEVESDTETSQPVNQELLWEQYRSVLVNALTRGQDRPFLQILTTPIDALWDSEDPTQFKRICNAVPFWGAYYSASPYQIDEQYKSFINNIRTDGANVKSTADKQAADTYAEQIAQLSAQLEAERPKCLQRFIATNPKPDLKPFMDSCLANLNSQVEDAKILYQFFVARAYDPVYVDLMESRADSTSGTEWYEAQGSLKRLNQNAATGQLTSLSVSVNRFTSITVPKGWNDVAKGLTRPSSLTGSFFNVAVQGATGMQTSTEKFQMTIDFAGYGVIRASPEKWFRHGVIRNFANGPFIHAQPNLFGEGGTMRLKPTTFYIAYKPRISIIVDRKDEALFKGEAGKSSSGLFSSSKERVTVTTENVNIDTVKITMESNSMVPKIIAIESEYLP